MKMVLKTCAEVRDLTSLMNALRSAWWSLTHRLGLIDILDILIVAIIAYQLLMLTRQTRGSAVLKGLVLLLLAVWLSSLTGLTALNWLLTGVINNGALVLVILFQPELRKALEQIGRGAHLERTRADDAEENASIPDEIIQCMTDLSRRRVGALIVLEQNTGLRDIIETGTAVDARISAPLLENIFEPNTPLHDGAVVIRGTRVVAAACILTLTERNNAISRELGTRHRAALGVSETTDAVALIVSEETGIMSVAQGGRLTRHLDAQALKELLSGLYEPRKRTIRDRVADLFRKGEKK